MKKTRLIAGLLALAMLVGMLPTTAMAAAAGTDGTSDLIEVASLSEVTVPSAQDEKPASNLVDGDLSTLWVENSGTWPANVDFALPGNMLVKRVEVDFEHYSGRTFDLQVGYAVNNVTSDYVMSDRVNGHSADSTYIWTPESDMRMTHVRISLLGTNGQAWPAMAEVRIYAVNEQINLSNYDDITSYASAADKDGGKEWNFHGNQQVVGFKATLADGASGKVLGKLRRDTGWTTYVSTLTDGDNILSFPTGMSVVRVEMADFTKLTNFQIYGTYTAPAMDSGSVAFDKPTHGNFDAATSYLVNDGDTTTVWRPEMYPAYVDIDLEENYNISEIQVITPSEGFSQYSVYTSMDGRDFDLVGEKEDENACAADGDKVTLATPKEARIVRVYLEYYSQDVRPGLNEVRVIGEASGTTVQTAPAVDVGKFEDSDYAAAITDTDVIAEVQGIIRRQVGAAYVNWFSFAIADQGNGYDYFTLSDEGGKIKVTGNNGVSLATGVNHYLKYFCNVHISQVGNQVDMPARVVPVGTAVHRETKFPVRYAYNYCTHSYSMAFWGEDEWRSELDWLALNGVNVVLDVTGQEEVWRQFLMKVGYTHQEAKDFLAGPGYYAWAYMANLTGFGGPVHDSWLEERTELGRKNQRIMRTLGMEPVLQAFSGMVPVDIATHDPAAAGDIIAQGTWCSFQRPAMLKTDTATYDEYAAKFYKAQKDVFGDAKYYATDPFHEGGNTGGMSGTTVASALLDSLLEFDSDAVWVIQSWQGNPSNALLNGLRQGTDRRAHALVLDLWAEHSPHNNEYGADTDGDGIKEFSDTPWVWCQLNNFGGRMGLHGHLDALAKNIPAAANGRRHMAGIGISPEGSQENPLLYDFLFETIWTQNANGTLAEINVDQWLKDYARRRYGIESRNAEEALKILSETVYKSSLNMTGQGAPETVVNARPALSIGAASTWGNNTIGYSKAKLEKAAELLLADYNVLSDSDAYLYDVADILKQVLSNSAQAIHSEMAAAYSGGNTAEFDAQAEKFLALIALEEKVLGTRKEFLFGTWTTNASELAENADDFTQRLYLRNAKALVTTWGSIQQCNAGGLKDYSNRQWAGLTNDYYKVRWTAWIDACKENLGNGSTSAPSIDWFPWEWAYARDGKPYSNQPNGLSLKTLGEQVLEQYSVRDLLGGQDINPTFITVKAGSQELTDEDTPASNVLDRDSGTIWHSQYSGNGSTSDQLWIAFDLGQISEVGGLRYLPRQGGGTNGIITGYKVYVSSSDTDWAGTTDTWTEAASGIWANNREWKEASFSAVDARYVKLMAVASEGGFASAAEIRVTGSKPILEYNITYVLAGGTLPAGQSNPDSYTTATEGFVLHNPTLENYTFAGWTGTGLTGAVEKVAVTAGSTGDRSYTAAWVPENYTITYDLAGGTVDGINPDSYTVESAEFTLVSPTRKGYTFAGWTGDGLTEPTVDVTIANGSTGARSYTATWTPVSYAITYELAGGALADGQTNPDSYTVESTEFTLVNPTRENYTFAGWTGGGLTEPTVDVTIANGSTGNRSYTATWTPVSYAITYELAGGALADGQTNPDSYTVESAEFSLVNPTREGYTFAGWTGGGLTEPTVDVTIANGSTGNRSYTATWTLETYTITYDLAGGALADGQTNPDSYTVESAEFTLVNPTREGYTFAGWTETELTEATLTVTIPSGSTGNRSYTATWRANGQPSTPGGPIFPVNPPKPSTSTTTETTENGETVTTVTDLNTGDSTVTVSAPDGSRSEIVNQGGSTTVEATISQTAVDNAEDGAVMLPAAGLTVQGEPTVTVMLPEDAGSVIVDIPVSGTTIGTVAVQVNPDGTEQIIMQALAEDGVVSVPMDGAGTIRIIDNSKSFQDVGQGDWFTQDVAFVSSRELFLGTGAESFSPQETMSRGMLATVLYRYAGEPETIGTAFADVASDTYFSDAVIWAAHNNIVLGVDETHFAPNAAVSRQQLAVMLYRFAGSPDVDGGSLAGFTDGAQVSDWARQAMEWAVGQGIIQGNGSGQLAPSVGATRAEVAAMLHRFTKIRARRVKS